MQPITHYKNIKKENLRMINQMKSNQRKQERKDLLKILKYLIDIGVFDDDKTINKKSSDTIL
jgi:hypothetical protein